MCSIIRSTPMPIRVETADVRRPDRLTELHTKRPNPAPDSGAAKSGNADATTASEATGELPNVLIIGDSISIGYTPMVKEGLQGKANVKHAPGNNGDTRRGLANLNAWLGTEQWDVIHFNWGLHDLCYRNPKAKRQGNRDKVNGVISVPIQQYEKNLDELVQRLKKSDATLIWATTTKVPEGESGRVFGDDVRYNAVAAKVMQKHGVVVNDLHQLSDSFPPELFTASGNVHYKKTGSAKLADQVIEAITQSLAAQR